MAVYIFSQMVKRAWGSMNPMRMYVEQAVGKTCQTLKYIFTEVPEQKNVDDYRKDGIDVKQLVNIYQYMADNHALECSVKAKDKLEMLKSSLHYTSVDYQDTEIRLIKDGYVIATVLLDEKDTNYIWGICYFSGVRLVRMEVYANSIIYTNYYVTAKSENGIYAKLARRVFHNPDASVAYEQIFEGEKEWFLFFDGKRYTKQQFMVEFIKRLNLTSEDVVLLDCSVPGELIRTIFAFGKVARIIVMAYMGRNWVEHNDYEEAVLKGYYYYWFPYIEKIDTMIVPTREQKEVLEKELIEYHRKVPDIEVAAIGGEFTYTDLHESYEGNLALSWSFTGKPDGFLIHDEFGMKICEIRNAHQHYVLIKGYEKECRFVIKAYVDTAKGKMVVSESGIIHLSARQYEKADVSLIIPAFNAAAYINRTIDNALAQSFSNVEIIVVDDGSTDHTWKIVEWYTRNYTNVVGIYQENSGTPAARNTGIEHASGEYIGFMDNDDMIRPEMIEKLYNSAKKNGCDIAVTSVYMVTNTGYVDFVQYGMNENEAMMAEEFVRNHYMKGDELGCVVWNKLYRTSLVKKYRFPLLPYDDVAWTPYVLLYAEKVCYLNGHFYEWDRTVRSSTLLSEWNRYTKEEMLERRKKAIIFYLENGNPQRRRLLKDLTKIYLRLWERTFAYGEYGKLWEWIEKKY